jgi:hypothetical protein
MAEQDDRATLVFAAREGDEVTDVTLESEWTQFTRTLIAASVVRHEIESIGSSREPGERPSPVESPVDGDERGFGSLDAAFGDGETRYRRIGNEVQSVGSGDGTHAANLPFDDGEPPE